MPEPHILLTVVHGTDCGRPAPIEACRAGAWPRPAGSTQPISTSLTSSGFTPARSTAALIAALPSCGAVSGASTPWKPPMAVRAMPTMTIASSVALAMAAASCSCRCAGRDGARRSAPGQSTAEPGRPRVASRSSEYGFEFGCFSHLSLFAIPYSLFPRFAHAPSVPRPAGGRSAKGATGTRAPHGRPGGRLTSGPSRPGRACSGAPCESPLGPLRGPLGCLAAPALRRFLSWYALRLAAPRHRWRLAVAMQPLGGRRFPAIAGASSSAGFPGLLDLGPPTRGPTFQAPIAATLGAGIRAPRRKQRRAIIRTALACGDKACRRVQ